MSAWKTHIAGVSYPNADGGSRQALLRTLKPGDRVQLQREWGNDYDPNAIAVHGPEGQLGYVPAKVAARLVKIGFDTEATVVSIHYGSSSAPTAGAEISINTIGKERHEHTRPSASPHTDSGW